MNKIKYSIYASVHNAYSNKKIAFVIVLSYYFGLLLPFYCLANIEVFRDSINTIEIVNSENTYIVDLSANQGSEYLSYEETLSALDLEQSAIVTSFIGNIQIGEKRTKISVAGVGAHFEDFERLEIIEGTFPPKELSNVIMECAVAYSLAKKYDLHIEDHITINDAAYKIAGVVNNFNYYNDIYIPIASVPMVGDSMQHKFYLSFSDLPTISQVTTQVELLYPKRSIYSAELASDSAKRTVKDGIAKSSGILFVGAVSIVIAILNTFLIISGKYEDNKKSIAIKLALGATKRNIFGEIFFENVLFIYIANLLLLITKPILERIVLLHSDFFFSWRVHLIILGISTIVAIGMSIMLKNKVTKASLSALLKGESL